MRHLLFIKGFPVCRAPQHHRACALRRKYLDSNPCSDRQTDRLACIHYVLNDELAVRLCSASLVEMLVQSYTYEFE